MSIQNLRLENGMQVISEQVTTVETVSLGIWLPYGSRDEGPQESGMFHFIEHTLFKGTPTRSARAIAEAVEDIGGVLDAYTAKEETCYSIRVRAHHLDTLLEILADMLLNPSFQEDELDKERQVILEEIKMEEDNPEDVVYERSMEHFWGKHPLARPILGTEETVKSFTSPQVRDFHKRFYRPDQLVVAAAGKLDHDHLHKRLTELFPSSNEPLASLSNRSTPLSTSSQVYIPDNHFEQVNFCLHFNGLSSSDPRRYAAYLLSTLLGGGMSSRLFQRIREEHGLAYHVGTFTTPYSDTGQFSIAGGCSPVNFEKVIDLCLSELRLLRETHVTDAELRRSREQFTASLVMGLEGTASRASSLAKDLMTHDRVFDPSRTIAEVDAVTADDIRDLSREIFLDESFGLCALGRLQGTGPENPWVIGA